MQTYRKKPVIIEAVQWDGDPIVFAEWGKTHTSFPFTFGNKYNAGALAIETLEGTMIANRGDWIIKGIAGEFSPCKPDIFDATYEKVEA